MHKHGGDIYRNQGVVDYSANINFRGDAGVRPSGRKGCY